ncbi:major Facilitator Superfamily protein [bacterium BMS3Abin02]|nr:major Facilitator Superfamily protein [bacterium BMS3Abin02]GBE21125.1 major Facilitator Superfamily protein [bacterium BMS3Bbin01]HDH25559.1 MFS transporter [Actinomycetota bacterium]HDK45259.1 MFS transporter [Actinomycetota bacterium]
MDDAHVRSRALRIVLAFGVVSLLADVVYEGARSVLGPFLATLGATAATVALISGIGEFVGYGLRAVAGVIADRTGRRWALTIGGYGLTVVAVPLLGWVGRVDLALALVVAERLGKALRTPARDTLLSVATEPLGHGWGFGLHEALDQTGAVLGPLLLAAALSVKSGDYRFAFSILAVPAVLVGVVLMWVRRRVGEPPAAEATLAPDHIDRPLRRYLAFAAFTGLGLAPFPLIAFHLTTSGILSDVQVPLLFAAAMAVDAGAALIAGKSYDRWGFVTLVGAPIGFGAAAMVFGVDLSLIWVGGLLWGGAMGVAESSMRAAVADLSRPERRSTAYGAFTAVYGIALLVGAVLMGRLYEFSTFAVMAFVLAAELLALVTLWFLVRPSEHRPA